MLVSCSSFGSAESVPLVAEPADAAPADGPTVADAVSPFDDAGTDAGTDAGASNCSYFKTVSTPGWGAVQSRNGGTMTAETTLERPSIVASVSGFQRAVVARNLPTRVDGKYKVSVDVAVSVSSDTFTAWLVTLIKLKCTTPAVAVTFALVPGNQLGVEAEPASGSPATLLALTAGWNTLTLDVDGGIVQVTYAGGTRTIMTSSTFSGAVGCTLEVGADAVSNIPVTRASFSRACVQ